LRKPSRSLAFSAWQQLAEAVPSGSPARQERHFVFERRMSRRSAPHLGTARAWRRARYVVTS
jgi:hypothetical protein